MSRTFISDWTDGAAVEEILLVRDKQVRTNRNGNTYLFLELDDRTGSMTARYWNSTEADAKGFEAGDFLLVRGKVQLFQGQLQLIVNSFQRADPARVEVADFIPTTDKDIAALERDLREILGRIANPHLSALVRAYLMDERLLDQLRRAPAGVRNHHAYVGGLLEHIVNLLKVSERIADLYPDLWLDLLKMGIFLHDLGKTRELSYERTFFYSDEGQLIGHLVIGVTMLEEKLPVAEEIAGEPMPQDLVLQLKHMILSHHGTYEFGSPKLPMTPEAIALHHLDNLDAKVHNFARAITTDPQADSPWTPYDAALGRRLYKGASRVRPRGDAPIAANGPPKPGVFSAPAAPSAAPRETEKPPARTLKGGL